MENPCFFGNAWPKEAAKSIRTRVTMSIQRITFDGYGIKTGVGRPEPTPEDAREHDNGKYPTRRRG
jgi:hypothetical protein